MCCSTCEVHLIYSNSFGSFLQCDRSNCYILKFENYESSFHVRDFLLFKKRVDAINIHEMLQNPSRDKDFEIIMPFRCASFFILNINQIIQLKEFLNSAKFHLELYSVLRVNGIIYHQDSDSIVLQ